MKKFVLLSRIWRFFQAYALVLIMPLVLAMMSVKPGDAVSNFQAWFNIDLPVFIDRRYAFVVVVLAVIYLIVWVAWGSIGHGKILFFSGIFSSLVIIVFFVFILAGTGDTLAGQICPFNKDFSLVKSSGQRWSVVYTNKVAYVFDAAQLDDLYGAKTPPGGCEGLFAGEDYFGIRVGHENDLLIAFGIIKNIGLVTGLQRMYFFPHDWPMVIESHGHDFAVNFGKKHDLNARFCWNQGQDLAWTHNHFPRDPLPLGPCVSKDWPYAYPNSGSERVEGGGKGQLVARSLLSVLGVYRINGIDKPWGN